MRSVEDDAMPTEVPFIVPNDWIWIAFVFAVYTVVLMFLRRRPKSVEVTQYCPPEAVTPALAAFLWNGCTFERAFVSALISLGWKGYLQIHQNREWYILKKLREPDSMLPSEESIILSTLFFPESIRTYQFSSRDCTWILETYRKFCVALEQIVEPEFVSLHTPIWYGSIALSVAILAFLFRSTPVLSQQVSIASILYLGVFIAIGGSACIAALRAWPATVQKLVSYLRQDGRPRRPFEALDVAPVVLTGSSLLGFAFLGALTSGRFALMVTVLFCGNAIFRGLLKTPTRSGHQILTKLEGYREFLSRAEADRLNRENEPGYTPDVIENCTAYAVALDAEHGWGEEFVENLLEMVQFDAAYYGGTNGTLGTEPRHMRGLDALSDDVIQLHIPQTPKR
jgi:Predicted membrane protein (DUF2207)